MHCKVSYHNASKFFGKEKDVHLFFFFNLYVSKEDT